MQAPAASLSLQRNLARLVRQQFVQGWCVGLVGIDKAVLDFLGMLRSQTGTQRDMQIWQGAWMQFQQHHAAWVRGAAAAGTQALSPVSTARAVLLPDDAFELLSDEVVESRIAAARMAQAMGEQVHPAFAPLRQRLQFLEGRELPGNDILQPETLCLLLVGEWGKASLSRSDLALVTEPMQRALAHLLQHLYAKGNDFLTGQGVAAQKELRVRVKQSPATTTSALPSQHQAAAPASLRSQQPDGSGFAQSPGAHLTPLARARQRAYGVLGQVRRLLGPLGGWQGATDGTDTSSGAPGPSTQAPTSVALASALAAHQVQAEAYYSTMHTLVEDYSQAAVARLAGAVRERSVQFKRAASTDNEKAIIEVVALMFQSILSEERIPPVVRVWFARLQVPVLRVALAEPEFFGTLNHPARQLIDRMGSVVLGFDATTLSGSTLEAEVRRVVQVIEQYPETGRRVFQLVHDEFEKFLAKFLTEKHLTARLVSVAQQVEQKETLVIQYTIELRSMLKDMPVRDEVREFLFKTWVEVLALSAVRGGAQHADTLAFKRAATDLVWAASAKPHRNERTRVIQALPGLLQRLRQGLALVGITGPDQDARIKVLTDLLAEAFLAKTEASIPQERIEAMAQRLENLEDFMADAALGEFPLDAEHIELGLGIDASGLHVLADQGAPVKDQATLQWALELPLGQWFTMDHNSARAQVQYVWQSQRKQLHLFAATNGSTYLVQLGRLCAYLQSGLLLAQEEEGLTVRATRDALAKLGANPERLLG